MRSIGRNLILWLLVALGAGMAIVMATTYAVAYAQITRVFDSELVKVAEAVQLGEDWRGPGRIRVAPPGFGLSLRAYGRGGEVVVETIEPSIPQELPKLYETGLRVLDTSEGKWRLYTHASPEGIVQVAQSETTRTTLARSLSLRTMLPELVLIPFFVLFMAWMLRRGLAPLRQISRRVEERDATRLDPLPSADVPAELQPLIAEINALIARLEQSMAAQRRFVADAAHELRTPVAALALQAKVAQISLQPATRALAFAELDKGVARATRVVEQLLRLAQLAPEAPPGGRDPVDVAAVAREVVGGLAPQAREQGIDLGADAPGPAPILGDRLELRSLITNLVENALRYAPGDSEVTVMVERANGKVNVSVLDAGPGIPAAERERVFERFHRASGDDSPGVGLGLAIVKAIAERHGAEVRLEDARPGRQPPGLAARVAFPAAARE